MRWIQDAALLIIGLSGGVAVGSGFVAFITVLDIIPRLTQLTHSKTYVKWFEWALIIGVLLFTLADFFNWALHLPSLTTAAIGLFAGIFVGTLAAGLTEVLNVFPLLAKRLNLSDMIILLLMAMVLGKTIGSLVQWLLTL